MVVRILAACPQVHVLRDPTRGGLAASLNEIATSSSCGIVVEEAKIPIEPTVRSACEILGLDPFLVANEGKLICMVPSEFAANVLQAIQVESIWSQCRHHRLRRCRASENGRCQNDDRSLSRHYDPDWRTTSSHLLGSTVQTFTEIANWISQMPSQQLF